MEKCITVYKFVCDDEVFHCDTSTTDSIINNVSFAYDLIIEFDNWTTLNALAIIDRSTIVKVSP